MVELGQLESRHAEFAKRNTRIVAVSLENLEETTKGAKLFPHLSILSDENRGLSVEMGMVGPHMAPDGSGTNSPTLVLLDRKGVVRWIFRANRFIERLSPEEVLVKVDEYLGK